MQVGFLKIEGARLTFIGKKSFGNAFELPSEHRYGEVGFESSFAVCETSKKISQQVQELEVNF